MHDLRPMLERFCVLAVLALQPVVAPAQSAWPDRPIRFLVSGAAGGITDSVTRVVTGELAKRLGQSVIVENRPGASGMVAADAAARSPGDGYTFVAVFGSHAVNRTLHPKRPYNDADLTGVSVIGRYPVVLVAAKSLPSSLGALLERARANPDAVTFASGGEGTLSHLAGELLMQSSGVRLTHVPYKGGNTALPDLFAERVGIMFDSISTLGGHTQSGKLNALGVTSHQRSPQMLEVPTFAELGHPLLKVYAWTAILAPAKTPPPILERVSSEIAAVLNLPDIRATLGGGAYGMELIGGTPAQTNQFIDVEEKLWGDVIRKAGIRAQ